jgi:hypothetical protein
LLADRERQEECKGRGENLAKLRNLIYTLLLCEKSEAGKHLNMDDF